MRSTGGQMPCMPPLTRSAPRLDGAVHSTLALRASQNPKNALRVCGVDVMLLGASVERLLPR